MNYSKISETLRRELNNHGLANVLYKGALTAINTCIECRVLKCITINTPNPQFLETNKRYTCAFLTSEQLFTFAENSDYELSQQFLDTALAKGDECYAILDGEVLAAYGWYANTPTSINRELQLTFNPQYMYMYKGYTNDNYRGQRLHAVGMTRALQAYRERDYKGLVSYVEGDNFNSLKSCYRMGYKDFGTVYIMKSFGQYRLWHNSGCRDYDFYVELGQATEDTSPSPSFSQEHKPRARY